MFSIAEQVWIYVNKKPYVREAVEQDIVNYSALAREIKKEIKEASFEAVKVALLRAAKKLKKEKEKRERKVIELLRKSNFEVKNKVATIHSQKSLDIESFSYSKSPDGYIYICDESIADKFENKKELTVAKNLSLIVLKHKKDIEQIPGVAAFLFSALASEDINLVHILDCREDTVLVIREHDAPLAFSVLSEKLRV